MLGKAKDRLQGIRIELGVINDVDADNMMVNVTTESSATPGYRIPFMSPGLNQPTSGGFFYVPQVGTSVILGILSDGTRCILGYLPVEEGNGSYKAGMRPSVPGDFVWQGDNGNFMSMRSNGMIELFSTAICGILLIPIRNLMHILAENLILDCFAGTLEFYVDRKEDDSEGRQPCKLNFSVKQFADDKDELVKINMGNVNGDSLACSLVVKDSGNSGATKINYKLFTDGSVETTIENTYKAKIKGNVSVSTEGKIDMTAKLDTTVKTNAALSLEGNTATLKANSVATLKGTSANIDATTVTVSNSAKYPVIRLSPAFLIFLNAVSAVVSIPLPPDYLNPKVIV
jgi:hypothetical protein